MTALAALEVAPCVVSVIVPVDRQCSDGLEAVHLAYEKALKSTQLPYEFIYVLDSERPNILQTLNSLKDAGRPIRVIVLAKQFGEAVSLKVGCEHAHGQICLTLPEFFQIAPDEIPCLIGELQNHDMVVARRWPKTSPNKINLFQAKLFHFVLRHLLNSPFNDLGCTVRAFRRDLLEETPIYAGQTRFLPVIAHQLGFTVKEIPFAEQESDRKLRLHSLWEYARWFLDVVSMYFLIKFRWKPLRFFGLIGFIVFAIGSSLLAYLGIARLFMDVALADRPLVLLASLLVVTGIQIIAIGLIGELIIFIQSEHREQYKIEKII